MNITIVIITPTHMCIVTTTKHTKHNKHNDKTTTTTTNNNNNDNNDNDNNLRYLASLHAECDFLTKYFDVRKEAKL